MIISKNGKDFTVKENKKSWTVSAESDRVTVSVNVPKDICPTIDALHAYIVESNLF